MNGLKDKFLLAGLIVVFIAASILSAFFKLGDLKLTECLIALVGTLVGILRGEHADSGK